MLATLSVPWMCEMSKHSMRVGGSGRREQILQALPESPSTDGFSTRKRASKLCFALVSDQRQHGLLLAALRRVDLDAPAALFGQVLLQIVAVLEVHRHMNQAGNVLLIEVDLLQQRFEERWRIELELVLPEELAPVDDVAVAQVEQVDRDQRRLGVVGEDSASSPSAAAIFCFCSISSTVEIRSRRFAASSNRMFSEASSIRRRRVGAKIAMAAFEEQPNVPHGLRVILIRRQPLDTRSEASMDVVLQARRFVNPVEIHLAGRDLENAVNEVHQPVRQIAREIGAVVGAAVLSEPPRDVNTRELLACQLDVGVGLVVAQQDVEARLVLLDQVVFKRQRFLVVIDFDEVDVTGFGDQRSRSSHPPDGLR